MPLTDAQQEVLGLLSTSELIEATLRRYDDAIFAGVQDRAMGTTDTGDPATYRLVTRRFHGDCLGCIGLARLVGRMAEEHMSDEITPISSEEL